MSLQISSSDVAADATSIESESPASSTILRKTNSAIGAGLEDLGKGLRSQIGTLYGTRAKGPRYLEMAEGYITKLALDEDGEIIGYEFVRMGPMMEMIKKGVDANEAVAKCTGNYGRFDEAAKYIDPRHE